MTARKPSTPIISLSASEAADETIELPGLSPRVDPRAASRAAAMEALESLQGVPWSELDPEHPLRLVGRLLGVIAAINGPTDPVH